MKKNLKKVRHVRFEVDIHVFETRMLSYWGAVRVPHTEFDCYLVDGQFKFHDAKNNRNTYVPMSQVIQYELYETAPEPKNEEPKPLPKKPSKPKTSRAKNPKPSSKLAEGVVSTPTKLYSVGG